MEHEISFPNPLERTDLPKRPRRWPKVVGGGLALVALIIAFLPQILRTGPGRSLVIAQLERQTHMKVWMQDIRTSWFGGTTITNMSVRDVFGLRFNVKQIRCEASLWQLIRGRYDLGATTVEEPYFDYVIDYGDGKDFFGRMSSAPPAGMPGSTPGIGEAGPSAPGVLKPLPLSGQITLNNAKLCVTRGVVQQKQRGFINQFYTIYTAGVNGRIDIPASGADWTVDLAGVLPAEKPEDAGSFTLAGKVNPGKGGSFAQRDATADLKLAARNVPTDNLGWIINPQLVQKDYKQMMGAWLDMMDVAVNLDDGKLHFQTFKLAGHDAANKPTLIEGKPVIDVAARTPVITLGDTPLRISGRLPAGVGLQYLGYINPFLYSAVDGWMDLSLDRVTVPLGKTKDKPMVQGELKLAGVVLAPDREWSEGQAPTSLMGQWQALTGDAQARPILEAQPVKFASDTKTFKPETQNLTLAGNKVVLMGTIGQDGMLQMTASISLPADCSSQVPELNGLVVGAISGTVEKPYLDATSSLSPAARDRLRAAMAKHNIDQLNRYLERIKDQRGRPIMDDLRQMETLIGVNPTTTPTTRP